ncbi:helix-turn-helix transcriptional regulator [Bdellovibrionota bacterium FG-1]
MSKAKTKEELFLERLGKHIAQVRKAKGYSQDRIYLEGGFSRGTMSKIENGLVNPGIWTLKRIAETIGVPLKRLVDFE